MKANRAFLSLLALVSGSTASISQTAVVQNAAFVAVQTACAQVVGLAMPVANDKTTWRIDFDPTATTACQQAAQTTLTNFAVPAVLNVIPFVAFIARWTDAEYALLMQKRATAISAGSVALVKQWDQAATAGKVDLNSAAAQNFKAALVSANILTQARADAIFQ